MYISAIPKDSLETDVAMKQYSEDEGGINCSIDMSRSKWCNSQWNDTHSQQSLKRPVI